MTVAERFKGANVLDAGKLSPYWGEHAARYVFAKSFVDGKETLDIACGTGYGLAILKGVAKHSVGVDVDLEAVKEARSECSGGVAVLLGDGLRLPFANESFDIVTSFETLEHLHHRNEFLKELGRVLRKRGKLLLSTPNANYTKPKNGRPANPYHIHEYTPEELRAELEAHFRLESFLGQALNPAIRIPPFHDAQMSLPRDFRTQAKLLAWKTMNKMPFRLREGLSEAVWKKPFYPTEQDYRFLPEAVESAPVIVAVCGKE